MEMTETFEEKYQNLEREFAARVERDNRKFEEKVKRGDYLGIYLPNVRPIGPVDYVLVGMEPSLGGWAENQSDARKKIDDGFRNWEGVNILHFSIRKYCSGTVRLTTSLTWPREPYLPSPPMLAAQKSTRPGIHYWIRSWTLSPSPVPK